jgi:dTDP-4-amino-4,6-dideoxygalactose transaminase
MATIPFTRPAVVGQELCYIARALRNGVLAGDGEFTKKCHGFLEQRLGSPKVLLTTSCTDALEMAALLLDIQPGDEVIVPSFTFVSTANAFMLRGARIVFADIRPDTLNLDETLLEHLITPRTRAIVPVHYAGVGCEMDAICKIAARHQLAVVEDNAHGLFGKYRGRYLGTFGTLATQSFHETKNVTCGEGGALIINDRRHIMRAEIIREKGTNRSSFFRGEIDKYTWVDLGSSHLPADILAAFLFAQLESSDDIQRRRRQIWERYYHRLKHWADEHGVRLPSVPAECEQSYHMFYLVAPTSTFQRCLMSHLKEKGITAAFHYLPLHQAPMAERQSTKKAHCPVTESVSSRLLRLPFFNDLSEPEQERIIWAIHTIPAKSRRNAGLAAGA